MWTIYSPFNIAFNTAKARLAVLIWALITLPAINVNAQFQFEDIIKTESSFFTIDPLGNIYFSESGEIIKIDKPSGEKSYFSKPMYGSFDIIDSSDPFNILAFSSNLGIIAFLDKNLVEKEPYVSYDEYFTQKPELACNSRQGGFWIYYPGDWKFLRINRKNRVLAETPPMNQVEYNFSRPCFMVENDSRLYVSDKENGIFVFDVFGSLLFKIPLKNICTFQIKQNKIIYFQKEHLYVYDFFLHEESLFLLPEQEVKMLNVIRPYVYLLTKQGIKKYKMQIELF